MTGETEMLLGEIRSLRQRFDVRMDEITPQIATLSTQMKDLLGNGKPGRVGALESTVSVLKAHRTWMAGYLALGTTLAGITLAMHDHIITWLTNAH